MRLTAKLPALEVLNLSAARAYISVVVIEYPAGVRSIKLEPAELAIRATMIEIIADNRKVADPCAGS